MFGTRINGPTWRHRHRGGTESSVSGEGSGVGPCPAVKMARRWTRKVRHSRRSIKRRNSG